MLHLIPANKDLGDYSRHIKNPILKVVFWIAFTAVFFLWCLLTVWLADDVLGLTLPKFVRYMLAGTVVTFAMQLIYTTVCAIFRQLLNATRGQKRREQATEQ